MFWLPELAIQVLNMLFCRLPFKFLFKVVLHVHLMINRKRISVLLRLDAQLRWVALVSKMGSPALYRNPERADLVFTKSSMGL